MNTWKITGPTKISGEVKIRGNKNSALPCIAASLLLPHSQQNHSGIILKNIPRIKDVFVLCDILKHLGINAAWTDTHTLELKVVNIPDKLNISPEITKKIRGSILLLGPLAGKYKEFSLPIPGGDKIGTRPLNAHIEAFRDLGFIIEETEEENNARHIKIAESESENNDEKVKKLWLIERSVTLTENLLLFSPFMGINKNLFIYPAACEPHVVTLCNLLLKMGAKISGKGSSNISIFWKQPPQLKESFKFEIDSDHVEATTYAIAAALTKSDLTIHLNNTRHLILIDRYMKLMGVNTNLNNHEQTWTILGTQSSFEKKSHLKVIKAEPWPGFPTDVMSLFVVLATQCIGSFKFIEYMYDDRFGFVQALKDMGAVIEENPPHVIKVHGPAKLSGQKAFMRPDIRSGAALLLAALCANGTTELYDEKGVIERGYEKLPETLAKLGAHIENTKN